MTTEDKKEIKQIVVNAMGEVLEDIVIPRFDGLENRMDRVESRLDHIEERMDRMEKDLRLIKEKIDDIEERLGRLETNYYADRDVLYDDVEKHRKAILRIEHRLKVMEAGS